LECSRTPSFSFLLRYEQKTAAEEGAAEIALVDADIVELKGNLESLQKRRRKGFQMKHNVNSRRTSTFIRLRPSCPKEMKVNNQVLLAEVLLSEIFTSLAKAMYNKMRQEMRRRPLYQTPPSQVSGN